MPFSIFMNGPPGSGKTTLCKLAYDKYKMVHISTGDLLRENITKKTEMGNIAKTCISKRQLIPDDVIIQMIVSKTKQKDCSTGGWILDGFPRTVNQALALEKQGLRPTQLVELTVKYTLTCETKLSE